LVGEQGAGETVGSPVGFAVGFGLVIIVGVSVPVTWGVGVGKGMVLPPSNFSKRFNNSMSKLKN
jgi:hypothetical protein